MADAAETTAPTQEKGWLSSTFQFIAATNPLSAPMYWGAKASDYIVTSVKSAFVSSDNVVEKIGEAETFQTEEGKQAFAKISEDKNFTAALNAAIEKDPSVARGLAGGATANGGKLDMNKLAEALKDDQTRATFASVALAQSSRRSD